MNDLHLFTTAQLNDLHHTFYKATMRLLARCRELTAQQAAIRENNGDDREWQALGDEWLVAYDAAAEQQELMAAITAETDRRITENVQAYRA